MRLMAAVAGVVAVLAGTVGASRGDEQLLAVGVAFAALTVYLFARWRDAVGRGNPALLAAAVAIPLAGHVESLNVSVAAAVLLFEAVRQRG
jgi:tRNA(Leu) C34 or U34 (ribose-2'-O)-methylase TrmL